MADPVVVAEDLVKVFGRGEQAVRALDGVSLALERGTVLGVLGPNGAGKTTAVNVLTTLTRADSGSAVVAGVDVFRDPAGVRRRIGLAGQFAAVDENLTGRENLVLVGRLNHLSRARAGERADELLRRFSLTDAGSRRAKTYSGGMRRRLDLAAALVAEPPILFLDEPTTGLDPRSRVELWEVIEELVADGTSLLLTTQYLEEADRLAQQISVVDHGRVIAEGTPTELKRRLGATVVEVGLADEATAEQTLQVARGDVDGGGRSAGRARAGAADGGEAARPSREATTVRVPTANGPATLSWLIRDLDDVGVEPTSIAVREPSLDDVFLSLTGQVAEADGRDASDDGAHEDGPPGQDGGARVDGVPRQDGRAPAAQAPRRARHRKEETA